MPSDHESPSSQADGGPEDDRPDATGRHRKKPPTNSQPANKALEFERVLADVAGRLSNASEGQFDDVLTAALERLARWFCFDRSTILSFSDRGNRFQATHFWSAPNVPPVDKVAQYQTELPWLTHQIRSGHVVVLSSSADIPEMATQERQYLLSQGLQSTIAVPLLVEGVVIGAIGFGSFTQTRRWSLDLVSRLRLIAEVLALAVRRHQYARGLRQMARTMDETCNAAAPPDGELAEQFRQRALRLMQAEHRERRRMAEVLHEDAMQILATIGMYAQLAKARTNSAPTRDEQVLDLVGKAMVKLRQLHIQLLPDALFRGGLIDGIRYLADQMNRSAEMHVEVSLDGAVEPMGEDTRLFLYHCARKLLENVLTHSGQKAARLQITRVSSRCVRLIVSDEGIGCDAASCQSPAHGSFSLCSIREQAELLGGTMEVRSEPGKGTSVTVTAAG